MMSHRQTLAGLDIELFDHIYVDIIDNMVRSFKSHRCALGFDSLFLGHIAKEKMKEKSLIYHL